MAEFQKVMRQWVRARKATASSTEENVLSVYPLELYDDALIAEIEKNVMEWAAEHLEPVYPTWEEWLLDNGVFAPDNVLINGKCRFYMEGKPMLSIPTKKIYDRIPADIAQRLGIQPKEW